MIVIISQSVCYYLFLQHQSKVSLSLASGDLLATSACLGADTLLKLLGNYCRNKDIKTAITVGIVGTLTLICNLYFIPLEHLQSH